MLKVGLEQVVFSGQPVKSLTQPDAQIDSHVILVDDAAASFFRIDQDYAQVHDFARPGDSGLRSMIVDHSRQGHRIGSAALAALPPISPGTPPTPPTVT